MLMSRRGPGTDPGVMKTNASRCGCGRGDVHPIDVLLQEHATILAVLDAAEREVAAVAGGGPVREPFWRRYLDFLGNYADRCHHGKEEDVLFAELEQQLPAWRLSGPTRCMRDEHDEMRRGRHRVAELLTGDDAPALCGAVREGIDELRLHIGKENEVLFPMARAALDAVAIGRLRAGFARIEHVDMGPGAHQRFEALARALAEEAGEPARS